MLLRSVGVSMSAEKSMLGGLPGKVNHQEPCFSTKVTVKSLGNTAAQAYNALCKLADH